MSKKTFPVTKFRVPVFHPKRGDAEWVVWRADEEAARVAARSMYVAKHGFEPTYVGTPYTPKKRSPMLASAVVGMALAMSLRDTMYAFGEDDPYRAYHRMHGGHIFGW